MPVRTVLRVLDAYWPDGEPEKLNLAADACDEMGRATALCARDGSEAALLVQGNNTGPAMDAFAACWATYDSCGQGGLPATAAAYKEVASVLRGHAGAVHLAQQRIVLEAVAFVAGLVVAGALAYFTAGATVALAATAAARLVAFCAGVGEGLFATVAGSLASVTVFAGIGALEAALADVVIAQPIRVELLDNGGYSGQELADAALGGVVGGVLGGSLTAASRNVTRLKQTAAGERVARRTLADLDPRKGGTDGYEQLVGISTRELERLIPDGWAKHLDSGRYGAEFIDPGMTRHPNAPHQVGWSSGRRGAEGLRGGPYAWIRYTGELGPKTPAQMEGNVWLIPLKGNPVLVKGRWFGI